MNDLGDLQSLDQNFLIIEMNKSYLSSFLLVMAIAFTANLTSCSGSHHKNNDADSVLIDSADSDSLSADSIENLKAKIPEPGDSAYVFSGTQEILDYLKSRPDASRYEGGIIYTIAEDVPKYASRLIGQLSKYSGFIVVDKASMHVILYDKYGQVRKSYGMACARNYGTKHKKADSRTPEGFFSLEGKYDSTDWLFTNDNGYTSPAKGQFGPRFLRIKTPVSMQIGIHGTAAPWSIGHRASHGCIRITNENIMELFGLAEVGMPVIVLPGKRDREVNRREGYDIPFFPTGMEYAMSDAEKAEKVNPKKKDFSEKDKPKVPADSVLRDSVKDVQEEVSSSKNTETPDSI